MSSIYRKREVPEGYRVFPNGGVWIPDEKPRQVGVRPNPAEWKTWGKTTKATLFVGLKVGRKVQGGIPFGYRFQDKLVYGLVYTVRMGQVGVHHGASFVQQKGHYIPEGTIHAGPEVSRREPSMQVIVFPAPDEGWGLFCRNIEELADAFLDDLYQESIIVEFVKDGKIDEIGKYVWVPEKKRRSRGR